MEQVTIKIIDTQDNHVVLERFAQQGAPVLSWNGSDDNFQTIMTSELNFNMLSDGAQDGRYLDLFTGDESRYMVKVEKVAGVDASARSYLLWQGFLLPDQYSEPYENVNFFVNFTATDCLGLLKDHLFNMLPYDYNETVVRIIAMCLKKTNLYQDIYISEAFKLESVEWRNVFLNSANFRGEAETGVGNVDAYLSDATDYDSCYDVLDKILKALGSTLFSYGGKWYIIGWNKKHLVLDSFKVYDFHGNYKSTQQQVKEFQGAAYFDEKPWVYANSPLAYIDVNSNLDFEDIVYEDLGLVDIEGSSEIKHDARTFWNDDGYFEIGVGDANGEFLAADVNGILERFRPKKRNCVFYKLKPLSSVITSRYISLKREFKKFIGKEYEIGKVVLEIELELFSITHYAYPVDAENTETNFNNGLYNDLFRVDVYIGNALQATTKMNHPLFDVEDDFKLSFNGGSVGVEKLPGGLRSGFYNRISAVWKKKIEVDSAEGIVDIRLFQPVASTGDIARAPIYISKIEVKQVQESTRLLNQSRAINFSKKEKIDLDFWESKSDLTHKNFKVNYGGVKKWPINTLKLVVPLTNRTETETSITYDLSKTDADWLIKNYEEAEITKNGVTYFMKDVFGFFNLLEGYYMLPVDSNISRITFSKTMINNLFYLWQPFDGFTILTWKTDPLPPPAIVQEPNRDQSLKWVRYGSNVVTGYGAAYGRAMLDVKADMYIRVDGTVKKIVSPLDIVQFNWVVERAFWISSLAMDFSNGKTKVMLCECSYRNVNDNGII